MMSESDANKIGIANQLLADFKTHMEKREASFLVIYDDVFQEILNLYTFAWKKSFEELREENKDIQLWAQLNQLYRTLTEIISEIERRALTERGVLSFVFFQTIQAHLEANKELQVHQFDYVDYFPIFKTFFTTISNSEHNYELWEHEFPPGWKITEEHLLNSLIARKWLLEFLNWAQEPIRGSEFNLQLEDVSANLFPEVDPVSWSIILTFIMRSPVESRVGTYIEHGRVFGFMGRIYTGWIQEPDSLESSFRVSQRREFENSARLALFLGQRLQPFVGIIAHIDTYISELKDLRYDEEEKQHRRDELLEVLMKIKELQESETNINIE